MRHLFIYFLFAIPVFANDTVIDRYTLVDPVATAEQQFPLIQIKTITIASNVVTNADAVVEILSGTGYSQALDINRSDADKGLMQKPVADINREFINMTIHEMLKAIAGVGYAPVVDPINRLVAFEKTNEF